MVVLSSVSFAYQSRPDRHVLRDYSVTVPRNKLVCFRGQSGTGKSTLLSLISGLYVPSSGRMVVDSVDMSTLDSRQHHQLICTKMFGVVEQASESLLSGSVDFNIRYGKVRRFCIHVGLFSVCMVA
jgi:ABC-type bacteriocin/lantibiotic exporter with double-glycine peptidase domain